MNQDQLRTLLKSPGSEPDCGLTANVDTIAQLEAEHLLARTPTERVGDRITAIAGTGWFGVAHLVWFGAWMLLNSGLIPRVPVFDPFPFTFLTMLVSLEAIFLTICVLISQSRITRQADRWAHLDLQVNLLAEQESTAALRLLQRIADRLGIEPETEQEAEVLAGQTDVRDLVTELDRKLPATQ